MEEKIITLCPSDYRILKEILNSEQECLVFQDSGGSGSGGNIISIPNPKKLKSNNVGNDKNIVQKLMDDIIGMAEEGSRNTRESGSEKQFSKIKSDCKAVIVSVTSS